MKDKYKKIYRDNKQNPDLESISRTEEREQIKRKNNANPDEEMKEGYGQLQEQRSPCPDLRERDASSGSEASVWKNPNPRRERNARNLGGICLYWVKRGAAKGRD